MLDIDVMMIQCDKCNVWQHGQCVGIWTDGEAPDGMSCSMEGADIRRVLLRGMSTRNAWSTEEMDPVKRAETVSTD